METLQSIPIVFGVTGHRDLRDEDIPKLEERVRTLFKEYQTKYPHTELIVISALAEGADMLVARVAKELGVTLHVLLPYQEEEYLDSFMDREANEAEFQRLKAYASKVEVNSCVHTYGAESCYQQLGEKIADDSNILLALWDGVDNGKSGGTSAIVKYQREGFKENRFDALDGNALFIITTPRRSNSDVETDFSVKPECLGKYIKGKSFDEMLEHINKLNAKLTTYIPKEENEDYKEHGILEGWMRYFEDVSGKNQKRFKIYAKIILILTAVAIACLEIMHALRIDYFILGYGVGLLLVFGLYHFLMHKGDVQDDFVYSRGFAEALRVQNAWNGAELGKSVARYYLKDQHHKFTWIKTVLKNMSYMDDKVFTPNYDKGNTPADWISGQVTYFTDALKERHEKYKFWEFWEKVFYRLGFGVLILMLIIAAAELFHAVEHGGLWFNWHYLVLASGLLLLVAAFIGEKYMKIEGFEEEIYHFNGMLSDFKEAQQALEKVTKGSKAYRKIIYDLGIKALEENSKWVVLHDKMRVKPSLE